jgi:phosphopantetheinyl transferase (holo-ACP synthase)
LIERSMAEWSAAVEGLRDRTFLTCWTRKEACVKTLGVGLSALSAWIEVGCDPDLRAVAVPLGMAGPEAVGRARCHFQRV